MITDAGVQSVLQTAGVQQMSASQLVAPCGATTVHNKMALHAWPAVHALLLMLLMLDAG